MFGYLSDFTTTTEWDPGTVATVNQHGDGGVGTTYLNTSTFLGRKTQLTYIVVNSWPGKRIQLRGENKTVIAVDTMTFRSVDAGTEVTYTAEFTFKGPSRSSPRCSSPPSNGSATKPQSRHAQSAKPALTKVVPNSPPASSTPPVSGQLRITRHRCMRHPRQGHHGCVVITRPGFAGRDRGTPRP